MTAGGMKEATEHELRKIRELSDELLGHPDRLFSEISPPDTSAEARLMLGALHKVRNGARPLAGAETQLVQMIEDVKAAEYDGPPEPKKPSPVVSDVAEKPQKASDRTPIDSEALAKLEADPEPAAPEEAPEPAGERRQCEQCAETKPIEDFQKWGRGRKRICIACDEAPDPTNEYEADVEDPDLIESLLKAARGWTAITDDDLAAFKQALIAREDFLEDENGIEGVRVDRVSHYTPRHRRFRSCPACGEDLSTTAILEIGYTFERCDCTDPEYTHLVEQLWHREHMPTDDEDDNGESRWQRRKEALIEQGRIDGRREAIEELLQRSEDFATLAPEPELLEYETPEPVILWRIQKLALAALGLVAVVVLVQAVLILTLALR